MTSPNGPLYDPDLSMHRVERPPLIDYPRLKWLRWITARDSEDGYIMGASSGPLALDRVPEER